MYVENLTQTILLKVCKVSIISSLACSRSVHLLSFLVKEIFILFSTFGIKTHEIEFFNISYIWLSLIFFKHCDLFGKTQMIGRMRLVFASLVCFFPLLGIILMNFVPIYRGYFSNSGPGRRNAVTFVWMFHDAEWAWV